MMQEASVSSPSSPKSSKPVPTTWLQRFKQLDIYTKIEEDYRVQTSGGALLSLIGWALITILILGEVKSYATPQVKEHMIVDTTLGQQLRINVDITFHALSCAEVHLDAMDVAGDNQLNIEHDMLKQRLSEDGAPIFTPFEHDMSKPKDDPRPADYCGSCYGAESEDTKCCNTCDEIKQAYDKKGWAFNDIQEEAEQCARERADPASSSKLGEGCQVTGSMRVNKVGGNFHIAHGQSIVRDGHHIHQFIPAEAPKFNVSHTVNSVSFGDPFPHMPPNPLDHVERRVDVSIGTGLFQYFIRVIPTVYTDEHGSNITTNQYTITERFRPHVPITAENPNAMPVLPGIFFVYELSPFMVQVNKVRMPLSHLLTKLCAIIGGVFTVLGVLDSGFYRIGKLIRRK